MASQGRNQARKTRDQACMHAQTLFQKMKTHSPGPLGWVALIALGGVLATGSVITLIVLMPIFLFFSPILVPAGIAGFFTAAGAAFSIVTAISWVYRYFKGKHPPGTEHVEYAMGRLHDTAEQVKHKARDMGGQI